MPTRGQSIQALIISGLENETPPKGLAPVIEALRLHWKLVVICTCFGLLAGVGIAIIWPKSYDAIVTLAPVDRQSMSGGLQSLVSQYSSLAGMVGLDLGGADHSTDAALALVQSRHFLEQFISDHNLLPILFPKAWDAASGSWKRPKDGDHPSLQDGYGYFYKRVLAVLQDRKTGLISLTVSWKDPVIAASWANDLVARVNRASRELAAMQADDSLRFLHDQLPTAESVGLQQAINTLIQSQLNQKMLANSRPNYAFDVVDPAEPSDLKNYARPQPIVLIVAGFFLGIVAGLGVAVLRLSRQRMAPATSSV